MWFGRQRRGRWLRRVGCRRAPALHGEREREGSTFRCRSGVGDRRPLLLGGVGSCGGCVLCGRCGCARRYREVGRVVLWLGRCGVGSVLGPAVAGDGGGRCRGVGADECGVGGRAGGGVRLRLRPGVGRCGVFVRVAGGSARAVLGQRRLWAEHGAGGSIHAGVGGGSSRVCADADRAGRLLGQQRLWAASGAVGAVRADLGWVSAYVRRDAVPARGVLGS